MTKKQALKQKIEWNKAISEGRVVRSHNGTSFASYLTPATAEEAVRSIRSAGFDADIVNKEAADQHYLSMSC